MNLRFRHLIALTASTMAVVLCYGQTAIVVMRDTSGILFFADSRRSHYSVLTDRSGNQKQIISYDTVCKVDKVGDIFFGIAGMDSERGYKTANSCALKTFRFDMVVNCYKTKRRREVVKYIEDSILEFNFLKDPEHFREFQAVFFGIENNIPRMVLVKFSNGDKYKDTTELKDSVISFMSPFNTEIVLLGETDIIIKLIRQNIIGKMGVFDGIKYALEQQALYGLGSVSGPFEILSLKKNKKMSWLLNPLNCSLRSISKINKQ